MTPASALQGGLPALASETADLIEDVRALVGTTASIDESLLDAALRVGRPIHGARSART
ncbi:hypothetical protein ACFSHP_18225 [Novosphingobium panipatense]